MSLPVDSIRTTCGVYLEFSRIFWQYTIAATLREVLMESRWTPEEVFIYTLLMDSVTTSRQLLKTNGMLLIWVLALVIFSLMILHLVCDKSFQLSHIVHS